MTNTRMERDNPFSDIAVTIRALMEDKLSWRDSDSENYDEVFRQAYQLLHQDSSCQERMKSLVENHNNEALVKDPSQSAKYREEGNKYFQQQKYSEALDCYNRAVLVAPSPQTFKQQTDFQDFALSLTNRAAVLGKFKLYRNVIDDLTVAISSGYPKRLLYKALQRLAVAYQATGQERKAERTYKELYQALDDAEMSAEQKKKMRNDCLHHIKSFPAETQDKVSPSPLDLLKLEESNPNIPSLSAKVMIEKTEGRGRFTVAREDIRAGEVLVKERSAVISLVGVKAGSHCASCSRSCVAPLPCPHCCSAVFCSSVCRETALPHHLRECWMSQFVASLPASANFFMAPFLLVIRLILQRDILFHLNTFQSWQRGETEAGDQTAFTKLLMMVKHFDQLDLLEHLTVCGLMMNMLKCLQYLPNTLDMESETTLFQVISHYYAAVLSNIHTTSELRNAPNQQVSNTPVAVALFPDVALHINHSCDPNTFVIDMEDSQVTIASRNIQAGEEISQVYCGHFGDTAREARQALLEEKYHFQCGCEACQHDYPDANTCLERAKTFAETPPSGLKRELSEKELRELDEKNEEYRILTEKALMKGLVPSAINQTLRRLELISNNLRPPHILYMMGRVSLINYMCYLYANKAPGFTPQKLPVYF